MLHKTKSYAVITGASAGLGEEFARQLAYHGYNCILVARREDRLKEICDRLNNDEMTDGEASYFCADLSRLSECDRLIEALVGKRIHVFVNNAGFGDCSEFLRGDISKELSMIDLNIKTVHYLTKKMLELFDRQSYGYLLNTASSAGLMAGGPYMATYYATKAYVVSLTRAIAQELRETSSSVYIGALCPGPVNTEFNSVANVEFSLPGITSEICVREAIKGMYARKVIIVPTFKMKVATLAAKLIPADLLLKVTSNQQRKKIYG